MGSYPFAVKSTGDREKPRLILASKSPRRVELLGNLGLTFAVMPSLVDEIVEDKEEPKELVVRLALAKARAVAEQLGGLDKDFCLVLGADTIVVLDGLVIGKPDSKDNAKAMLQRLSGRCHEVYTAIALIGLPENWEKTAFEVSRVYMRHLEPAEIATYVETEEPADKAGAYALQGIASAFVEKIDGCFTNIIGLPIPLVVSLLRESGVSILGIP